MWGGGAESVKTSILSHLDVFYVSALLSGDSVKLNLQTCLAFGRQNLTFQLFSMSNFTQILKMAAVSAEK